MANKDKEEKKVLSIIKEDGTKEEVELLICFTFNDTKKEYVVYTRNEKDENGNVTVYISSVDRSGEIPKMGAIESDEEWSKIKDVLRELSKNDQKGDKMENVLNITQDEMNTVIDNEPQMPSSKIKLRSMSLANSKKHIKTLIVY